MKDITETTVQPSLAPWLTVKDAARAVSFYQIAFEAREVYRLEPAEAGFVVRLALGKAEWWISEESETGTEPLGGSSLRMILTIPNPDELFAKAIAAGATEIFPVGEEHGWRLGRLCDPFGLHWELGYPLDGH